ncbi:putative protein serine/threonine kinase [Cavenderia fasciculata]|uniref:Protein kinase domain-containing protein n=1 Tax=Cavenderia fasciculata TaxID=261658 RepID=F4PS63_CACFS|nr:putative protein serine/threonine kinase [Cavenderia fasciculata]EGG21446.1 putative protein serine/threonine kinase [Cavenderia fasciculata]|eukprot:XP_004359296.1 putative protein serine/threonine kinase [Cavenderia fasciculata]
MGNLCGKEAKPANDTTNKVQQATPDNNNTKVEVKNDEKIAPEDITQGNVEEFYFVSKELGRGAFSVVREGTKKTNNEKVALKYIEKKFVKKKHIEQLRREIDIMKKVNHPNVLALKEIFESDTHLTLVMELVTGGELFYKIVERGSFTEKDARNVVRQVCAGVEYLHSQGIAHRDLKPENLLCSGDGDEMTIKIADFGLSKIFGGGEALETSCGTPDYVAPEVLTGGSYDNAVDMWSIGVITYILLCGFPPFYASSQNLLFEKILTADYDFPEPEWTHVSESAKQFIRNLIVKDPEQRYTAKRCLEDAWITGTEVNQSDLHSHFAEKMKKYNDQRRNAQTSN